MPVSHGGREATARADRPRPREEPGARAHVLVVDSDETVRAEIESLLRAEGFTTSTAPDGESALAEARRALPDVVLTDLQTPGIRGGQLCQHLHEIDHDLPVIVMTAQSDVQSVIESFRSGAEDCLIKPLQRDALRGRLDRAIARRSAKVETEGLYRTLNQRLVLSSVRELAHAEAEGQLRARLASAIESVPDAFAVFGDDDRLFLCNGGYRDLVGGTAGSLVGKSYAQLSEAWIGGISFPDEVARSRFREEQLARRRDERTTTFDVRMLDGRRLRVTGRRTAAGGFVKTICDLTDEEQRAEELRAARAAAEAGSAAKSEFLSSMSHELRTPLNAILGFAQLLRRDKKEPPSDRHKGQLDQILKGGEHLLRLIDDILDLSRIEARGVSIATEPVSVTEVLDELRWTLESTADRQNVSVAFEAPPDLPMVAADRTRFLQILMNFGTNAIKYNRPEGTVTFVVSRPSPERVRVTVSDTGPGIPADKQDKLFQPFQRAGQETGPIEGTGIGLVVTKRLAELMDGEVGFRSVEGQGSAFWVDLPCAGARADAPHADREPEGKRGTSE